MERVLVTGGAGFIGSHTVDLALEKGYEVRVLDSLQPRVHPRGKPEYVPPDVEFIVGDVRNREDMARALEGVQYVFHLAAYQDYMPDFSMFFHVNTVSTALLYELIVEKKYPVRKVVLASSQSTYGEGTYRCEEHGVIYPPPRSAAQLAREEWEVVCPACGRAMAPVPIDERRVNPHTAYGISKYALEMAGIELGRKYGIPTAAMRYSIVQGPRNSFYNAYSGICRIFTLRLLHDRPPVVYEDGHQLRDYVYVGDVARANLLMLARGEADYETFNVGGGRGTTVLEYARIISDVCDKAIAPEVPGLFRFGDTRHTVSSSEKLRALGWEQTVPLERFVEEYVEWVKEQPDAEEYYIEAERRMRERNIVRSTGAGPA